MMEKKANLRRMTSYVAPSRDELKFLDEESSESEKAENPKEEIISVKSVKEIALNGKKMVSYDVTSVASDDKISATPSKKRNLFRRKTMLTTEFSGLSVNLETLLPTKPEQILKTLV